MDYNYHTHTYRCGHASGTEEEYILRAIEGGIKYMGFSDHIPLRYPNGYEANFRIPVAEAQSYVETIGKLREKYREQIEIKIGFEMEYYPEYFANMLSNASSLGAEYLILGQHYVSPECPNGVHVYEKPVSEADLEQYATVIVEAIHTSQFLYVAHPDMVRFKGDYHIYREQIRRICIASRESNIPLEINFLGIREKRSYPDERFWEIAGEEMAPVTFGFDAHDAMNACDRASLVKAKALVKKYRLRYIGTPVCISSRGGNYMQPY